MPALLFERRRFFDPGRNPYFRVARVQCFVASRHGRDVGTIAAVVDGIYQKEARHSSSASSSSSAISVARALLGGAMLAGRAWSDTHDPGPFNFNTNHEFALLVDGFDTDPTSPTRTTRRTTRVSTRRSRCVR
ncbi:MAG: hypothetical protein R3E53_12805 [Myxococcota bacterium]